MPKPKLRLVETGDGSCGGKVLEAFDAMTASDLDRLIARTAREAVIVNKNYCGGMAEKAEDHVRVIINALCRVLDCKPKDLKKASVYEHKS